MRTKIALAATAALAAGLTIASPAAAQDYRYNGYNNAPYGNAYGYNRGGDPRMLLSQVEEVKRDIWYFASRNMITTHERNKLMRKAENIQGRIARMGYNGIAPGEYQKAQNNIATLQREVGHDLRDRGNGRDDNRFKRYRGWSGQRGYTGYNGYGRY